VSRRQKLFELRHRKRCAIDPEPKIRGVCAACDQRRERQYRQEPAGAFGRNYGEHFAKRRFKESARRGLFRCRFPN
jgi:hypothetical protein